MGNFPHSINRDVLWIYLSEITYQTIKSKTYSLKQHFHICRKPQNFWEFGTFRREKKKKAIFCAVLMRRIIANGNQKFLENALNVLEGCGFPPIAKLELQGKRRTSNLALKVICFGILQRGQFGYHIEIATYPTGFWHADFLILSLNRILTQPRLNHSKLVKEISHAPGSNEFILEKTPVSKQHATSWVLEKEAFKCSIFLFYKTPFPVNIWFSMHLRVGNIEN